MFPTILPAITLNADCYTALDFGLYGAKKLFLRCRTAVAVLLASDGVPATDGYFTIPASTLLELDVQGSQIGGVLSATDLVANGTFTGNADSWTVPAGMAYSANTVVKNGDGLLPLTQTLAITAGRLYKLTYTVSGWSVGTVTPSLGGKTGTAFGKNGTFVEWLLTTDTTQLAFTPTNTARFTLDTISVQEHAFPKRMFAKSASGAVVLEGFIY